MLSRRSLWPAAVLLALLPAAPLLADEEELPNAEHYRVRIEYLLWSPPFDAELQKGFSSAEGTLLDAQLDLGIEERRANPLRGTLRFGGGWKLRATWTPLHYDGDVAAAREIHYGTAHALLGQRVVTSLKGNLLGLDLQRDVLQVERGFLGLLAGVRLVDVDTTLVAAAGEPTAQRVMETERLPIPVVGLAGRVYPHERLSLEAELSGLTVGDRGHLLEIVLGGRVHLLDRVAGTVGWRRLALTGRDGRDFLELSLGTWTLGLEISL